MGDLESEITELDWLNLFCSSIEGKPDIQKHLCLLDLGYIPQFFSEFKFNEHSGGEIRASPDVILWKENNNIVLIIEVKGENSVEEEHLNNQLDKYKKIPLYDIQELLRNAFENSEISITQVYVGIIYRKETIEDCYLSDDCQNRLNRIMQDFLLLTQSHGEELRIHNANIIDFDADLRDLLIEGINLPEYPPRTFYLGSEPSLEGVIWGIINFVHDKFYEGNDIIQQEIHPIELRDNVFSYSHINLTRMLRAFQFLEDLKLCKNQDKKYIFNFEEFPNPEEIKPEIKDINEEQIYFQSDLSKWGI